MLWNDFMLCPDPSHCVWDSQDRGQDGDRVGFQGHTYTLSLRQIVVILPGRRGSLHFGHCLPPPPIGWWEWHGWVDSEKEALHTAHTFQGIAGHIIGCTSRPGAERRGGGGDVSTLEAIQTIPTTCWCLIGLFPPGVDSSAAWTPHCDLSFPTTCHYRSGETDWIFVPQHTSSYQMNGRFLGSTVFWKNSNYEGERRAFGFSQSVYNIYCTWEIVLYSMTIIPLKLRRRKKSAFTIFPFPPPSSLLSGFKWR